MKIQDRAAVTEMIEIINRQKNVAIAINTEFGICEISKKEAVRMIQTCEQDHIVFSFQGADMLILEYPE